MKKILSIFLSLALLVSGLACSVIPASAFTEPSAAKSDYSDCIKFDADHWAVGGGSEYTKLSFTTNSVSVTQSAWKAPYTTIEGLAPNTDYTLSFTYDSTCGDTDDSTNVTLYQDPHIVPKDNSLSNNVDSNGYKNKSAILSSYTSETGTFGTDNTKVTLTFTTGTETTYHLFISIGQCGKKNPSDMNATFTASSFSLKVTDINDYTSHLVFDNDHWGGGYWLSNFSVDSTSKSVKNTHYQSVYAIVNGLAPNTEYMLTFDLDGNTSVDAKQSCIIEKDNILIPKSSVSGQENGNGFTKSNSAYTGSHTDLTTLKNVDATAKKVTFYFNTTTTTDYNILIKFDSGDNNVCKITNFSLKANPSYWRHERPDRVYTKGSDGYTPITTDVTNWCGVYYELKGLKANTAYTAVVNYRLDEELKSTNGGFQFDHCMVTDLKFTPYATSNFQSNGYYDNANDYELYWHAVAHSTEKSGVKTDLIGSVTNDTENKQLIYKFTTATAGTYTLLTKLGGTALSLADPVVTEDATLNAEQAAIDQNFSFLGSAIRLASGTTTQALRFKAQVAKTALESGAINGQTVTEYGFVVFTKDLMPKESENLLIGLKSDDWEKNSIAKAAYKNDGSTDIVFAEDNTTKQFTAALTGITEANYNKDYVVRLYVKLSNGNTHYVTVPNSITGGIQYYQSSIAAVAQLALEDTAANYSDTEKTALNNIVETAKSNEGGNQ